MSLHPYAKGVPIGRQISIDRHNNSPIVTSKQTTTTPRRNESGEKKGETDSETGANVRRANVKRTALRVRSESAQ